MVVACLKEKMEEEVEVGVVGWEIGFCVQGRGCFFQAEEGIRDAQESHGLGDIYKRQANTVESDAGRLVCKPAGIGCRGECVVPVVEDLSLIHN